MLFTAIAATVVILPWAVHGHRRPVTTERPLADQTQLAEQPLTGIGGGETIREIHQDTPFSMVALTADGPHRHVGAGAGQASPTARGDPGTTPKRSTGSATDRPRDRAAPTRCSSASPPPCRSR